MEWLSLVSGFSNHTDAGLATLVQRCPLLHPDNIRSPKKGDAFLLATATHHPELTHIDLMDAREVTDAGLAVLMTKCKKLHPNMVQSHKKGYAFLQAVALHHPDTKEISLRGCREVTDAGLARLISGCNQLHPDKVRSDKKGDTFLAAVSKCCPDLTEINVSACKDVTDAGLAKLMKFCKDLHPDNVYSDAKGNGFVSAVSEHRRGLVQLNLTDENENNNSTDVTDAGLAELMEKCLDMHPDSVISELKGHAFLAAVADFHPGITEIYLGGCNNVTDDGKRRYSSARV